MSRAVAHVAACLRSPVPMVTSTLGLWMTGTPDGRVRDACRDVCPTRDATGKVATIRRRTLDTVGQRYRDQSAMIALADTLARLSTHGPQDPSDPRIVVATRELVREIVRRRIDFLLRTRGWFLLGTVTIVLVGCALAGQWLLGTVVVVLLSAVVLLALLVVTLRATTGSALTLLTGRAHLVVRMKRTRAGLEIHLSDHWATPRGQGHGAALRRPVLEALIEHVSHQPVALVARVANTRVLKLCRDDLSALGVDADALLRGRTLRLNAAVPRCWRGRMLGHLV